ncbi:pre-mRNA-splicing factor SPP2 [Ceratobasidium sp. AG-Ba]|nr:pre-mRNA-splicing factor SPP2 [Ceratobasidium sp. AG-Ba]
MSSKVSFTVRPPPRPTLDMDDSPTSSPLVPTASSSSRPGNKRQWASYTGPDSSDEEEPETEEMITGFDAMGVRRLDESKNKPKGPLVILPQKNRDWRAESMARKRQAANGYVPDGARGKVATGKDGSQGGLGTRGTINDGPS